MTKLIVILSAAAGLAVFSPGPVAASCTQEYAQCLSDSWEATGALRVLADVECGAEYVGCVRRVLLGI